MKRRVAIFAAREILNCLVIGGLLLAEWWLRTFGEQFGTGDVDAARRVVGILTGIWFIVTGNRVPKGALVPPSNQNAAVLQLFQRFIGWASVLTGVVFVVGWLALPVGWASYASNFFGGLLFFAAMFLVWRRAHYVTVEPRGI